ncbi:hypothetical protein ACIBQX_13430 [Nonomuraea sp. NPDC049714]|uniref:IS1096 element passenger TnpR family protein n=1 Tax=Nonomuraea sp. NPDC049714 TaxID=3364357 RepID=UPI00379EA595
MWRRVHLPSTATLDQPQEVIQVAMGREQHHLHLFGEGDAGYGDNARDQTAATLAMLIPRVGDVLVIPGLVGHAVGAVRKARQSSRVGLVSWSVYRPGGRGQRRARPGWPRRG